MTNPHSLARGEVGGTGAEGGRSGRLEHIGPEQGTVGVPLALSADVGRSTLVD